MPNDAYGRRCSNEAAQHLSYRTVASRQLQTWGDETKSCTASPRVVASLASSGVTCPRGNGL